MNLGFVLNLRFKLAAAFLLVSLLPLGIASFFAVQTANQLIASIVTSQLENVAADKQQLLQRWIAERNADLGVVSHAAVVRSMDAEPIAAYLQRVQHEYEVYRGFVVADHNGRTAYNSTATEAGDWSRTEWFQAALEGRRTMSAVQLDGQGRESVFRLAAPIPGDDGRPQGAVCAMVSTTAIVRWVLSVSLGETGECYLVDKSGIFLAHKDPRRILRENIAASGSFANLFPKKRVQRIYTDYREIAVLGASREIPGTPWYVVVEQDEQEAFATAYQLHRSIYFALAVTVAGAIGVSLWLAYSISAPVRNLSEAAYALARGDFDSPLIHADVTRHDEIGRLRHAFEHMADQLRDRHDRLQTRMGLTEAELHEAGLRLQHAIEAAARAEHLAALGRLASGVAHEIRTPLASLKLYLQSVQEDVTISPDFSEDFEVAMRQVDRIEATINHFLNFARPQDPVLTSVDLEQLIDDALVVVRPRANHQEVEVAVEVDPGLPPVKGDTRQLGEALVNLMVNALEEMPKGGRLKIEARADTSEGDGRAASWVRLDITDTGPGFEPAKLEKLFEPFYTTKAAGSGLGLSIVRGTIQRHGGIVRVRTAAGEGATFSLLLPAEQTTTSPEYSHG